jgi:hypothetical protein
MVIVHKIVRNRAFLFGAAWLLLLLVLVSGRAPVAWAHQSITVGDYTVEYGWVNEPAVAGQPNAVVINISPKDAAAGTEVDVSGLKIQVAFGGQTKVLTLQPLSEDTPGQFIAPMTPMRPGKYTVHLSGDVGSTAFDTDVVPEEVNTPDLVQFPVADTAQGSSSASAAMGIVGWLGIAGFFLGAIGTVLGVIAISRKPAGG